jgi:hypothetical protein
MGAVSVGRVVSAALNPVLTPEGFAGGQYGEGGADRREAAQIIVCAGHDEFSGRHPWLPQANDQERGVGACVDLVIEISAVNTVEFIDLEGLSLEETLRRVGNAEDADRSAEAIGRPLAEVLPVLPATLQRLRQLRP